MEEPTRDDGDLDPQDWAAFRRDAHRMLDDMVDYLEGVRTRPVWTPMPTEVRDGFSRPLEPTAGQPLAEIHAEFLETILPYAAGNVHPRFMGWVHGGGNAVGMMAEMVAAGLNANLGGRDHAPVEVERQVVRWAAGALGLPATAGGLLVTGASMANFSAILIARTAALGKAVRRDGVGGASLTAYASSAVHGCVPKALDMAGLGTGAFRAIGTDDAGRLDLGQLEARVAADRAAGRRPFLVVASAGTVCTGAIDDLPAIAAFCRREGLWFHVDGAIGALGVLAPSVRPLLAGLDRADSIAFDFHKWGQIPYDAGCILVRDAETQRHTFSTDAAYLRREARGLAAGAPWPCDLGPDLSRGFRALKVWYSLRVLGTRRLGAAIDTLCACARHLADRVGREPELELLAPVTLDIVCFRYRFAADIDRQNAELAADVQESGRAVLSTTSIGGATALRCAVVNHRSRFEDMQMLVDAVLELGRARAAAA